MGATKVVAETGSKRYIVQGVGSSDAPIPSHNEIRWNPFITQGHYTLSNSGSLGLEADFYKN